MYLLAILAVILQAALHGWSNILDSFLSNVVFKRLSSLIFFSSLINLILLPIIILLSNPHLLSSTFFGIATLIAFIEVGYQYPYYWALREADTSIVVSLFSIGDLFAPLLAFLIVGEHLMPTQYIGFFLVTTASIFLTLNIKKFKVNHAALLMLGVSILITIQTILYKYLFDAGVSFGTALVWVAILQMGFSTLLLIIPKNASDLKGSTTKLAVLGKVFITSQVLTWAGQALASFAILTIPVSMEKGLSAVQPIFVLVFALLFTRKFPKLFKEGIHKQDIVKKLILFAVIIVGVILITR